MASDGFNVFSIVRNMGMNLFLGALNRDDIGARIMGIEKAQILTSLGFQPSVENTARTCTHISRVAYLQEKEKYLRLTTK